MHNISQISRYVTFMEKKGFSAKSVLAGSKITSKNLNDPKISTSAEQYQIIVTNMIELTKNSSLGLELGKEVDYSQLGILGYAMSTSHSMEQAIEIWLSYSSDMYGSLIECELKKRAVGFELIFHPLLPLGPAYIFCAEEFLTICRQNGLDLSGNEVKFKEVELVYPRPRHHHLYKKLFPCPIKYNAMYNKVSVESPNLDTPIQNEDPMINELFIDYCKKTSERVWGKNPLETKIYNFFLKSPRKLPTMVELAKNLNLTERTLRRHLDQEGLSYRQMANNFRAILAKEYLQSTNLSIKQIAFNLGFNDRSHFQRFFKNHFAVPPHTYRDLHTNKPL